MKQKIKNALIGLFTFGLILSSVYLLEFINSTKDNKLIIIFIFELIVNVYAIKKIIKNIKLEQDDYKQNIFK